MWLLREADRRFDDVRRLCAARETRQCLQQLPVHYVVMREPRQHLDDVRVVVGCVGSYP